MGIEAKSFAAVGNADNRVVKDLGYAWDELGEARPTGANVRLDFLEKSGPGKKFHFDAAMWRAKENSIQLSSSFFDVRNYHCMMKISLHNIDGNWRELNGFNVNGGFRGQSFDNWVNLGIIKPRTFVHFDCWTGNNKPRYGLVQAGYAGLYVTGISANQSGSTVDQALRNKNIPSYKTKFVDTYFAGEPVGIRYLSNNGYCGPDGHRRSQVSGSMKSYQEFSRDILDEGTDRLGPLIEFTSGVGDDMFSIDMRIYIEKSGRLDTEFYRWNITVDTLKYKIDNPLLGYPDVKKPQQYGFGWPPRYDAKFYVKRGNWQKQGDNKNLQGKIVRDNKWKVF